MKLVLVTEWDVDEEDPHGVQNVLKSISPPAFEGRGYIAIKEKAEEVIALFADLNGSEKVD